MSQEKRPPAPAPEASSAAETAETAEARAAAAAAPGTADRAAELYDQLLRLKAEFENYRKRTDRERPELVLRGQAAVLEKLLPLYDLLLKAHDLVLKQSEAGSGATNEVISGLELIFREFTRLFEAEGVKPIESVGKPYDHALHEALGSVETAEHPEGAVVEELARGYTFKGNVLRPARVRVARAAEAAQGGDDLKQDDGSTEEQP